MRQQSKEFNYWPSMTDFLLIILLLFVVLWYMDRLFLLEQIRKYAKIESPLCPKLVYPEPQCPEIECPLCPKLVYPEPQCPEIECPLCPKLVCPEPKCLCSVQPKKPLIISLQEESGYRFQTGGANLSQEFKDNFHTKILQQISNEIAEANFNVIEVIGHTDGQPFRGMGNFDTALLNLSFTNINSEIIENVTSGSNADLGLLRALSVARFIHQELQKTSYKNIGFRIYSAGAFISPDNNIVIQSANSDNNSDRRRIELRFAFKKL